MVRRISQSPHRPSPLLTARRVCASLTTASPLFTILHHSSPSLIIASPCLTIAHHRLTIFSPSSHQHLTTIFHHRSPSLTIPHHLVPSLTIPHHQPPSLRRMRIFSKRRSAQSGRIPHHPSPSLIIPHHPSASLTIPQKSARSLERMRRVRAARHPVTDYANSTTSALTLNNKNSSRVRVHCCAHDSVFTKSLRDLR